LYTAAAAAVASSAKRLNLSWEIWPYTAGNSTHFCPWPDNPWLSRAETLRLTSQQMSYAKCYYSIDFLEYLIFGPNLLND
jgi:hypothetical protein